MRSIFSAFFALSFILLPSMTATAQPPQRSEQIHTRTQASADSGELRWKREYERVRWWQYSATPWLGLGGLALRFFGPDPPDNWDGENPFDDPISEAVIPEDRDTWRFWMDSSDAGFIGSMLYRVAEDLLVAGGVRGSWDVAWQLLWIDLQVFSSIGGTLWATQTVVGRERPYVEGCNNPDFVGSSCREDSEERDRSFFAGHPAVALGAAGATCSHHAHLDIYPGFGGEIACGIAMTNAAFVSVARVVNGSHHMTDLFVGLGVGAAAGWGIPLLLHYNVRDERSLETMPVVMPFTQRDAAGVALSGRW